MVLKRIAVQVTMLIIMSSGFTEHKFPSSPRRYMRAWYGLQGHYPDFSSIGLYTDLLLLTNGRIIRVLSVNLLHELSKRLCWWFDLLHTSYTCYRAQCCLRAAPLLIKGPLCDIWKLYFHWQVWVVHIRPIRLTLSVTSSLSEHSEWSAPSPFESLWVRLKKTYSSSPRLLTGRAPCEWAGLSDRPRSVWPPAAAGSPGGPRPDTPANGRPSSQARWDNYVGSITRERTPFVRRKVRRKAVCFPARREHYW